MKKKEGKGSLDAGAGELLDSDGRDDEDEAVVFCRGDERGGGVGGLTKGEVWLSGGLKVEEGKELLGGEGVGGRRDVVYGKEK